MKLRIIHTSDIHGYLYDTDYVTQREIGFLTLCEQFKKDENTLLIDGGDFIQGSPFSFYLAAKEPASNQIYSELLNKANYDVVSIGNHEFNFGQKYLEECYENFQGEILCANIDGLSFGKPYHIFEKQGFKIGVIGLITQNVPFFEDEKNIAGLTFKDIIETYRTYEDELKEQCDYIIVNYHGGCELDLEDLKTPTETLIKENLGIELFNTFKSIDLLLTGHQHRIFTRNYNNRVITQCGHQAQGFVEIEVDLDTKEILKNDYVYNQLLKPTFNFLTDEINSRVNTFLDQSLGFLPKDILINDHFEARTQGHPLINFIHDVQLKYSGADISAINLFNTSVGFSKNITMRQVIANYPFPNTLVVLKVSRQNILDALEISATYFEVENNQFIESELFTKPKRQEYQYDMFKGFSYQLDISKPYGQRVVSHNLEDKFYTICLNNYRASNFAWYPMYEDKEVVKKVENSMIDLITDYLITEKNLTINIEYNFKITK